MTLDDLVARLVEILDDVQVPYMVVGSVASSYHGEPRMTRDLDLVIDPTPDSLQALVAKLQTSGLYADPDAAASALANRSQFNAIDPASGWKVDLMIRGERPFDRAEFMRRQPVELPRTTVRMATAEDVILAKLEWALAGESERQLRDAAAILAVSGEMLDFDYLDGWAAQLGVTEVWETIKAANR
jgi:hypothetical protein